ncbi:hypothetical protein JXO52_08330 [bacterium]|nr:hypothetical protein [bacterium]
MFGNRLPKNRRFNIEYYYYDPAREEREGRRITFKRSNSYRQAAKTRSLIWLVVLLAAVLYALYILGRIALR